MNNNYVDIDFKLENYNYLVNSYIETIINLVDCSNSLNILPFKIKFCLSYIKDYIVNNKIEVLENGIKYLLINKDIIINFNLDKLNELDEDSDDNVSIKSCINNMKKLKNIDSNQEDDLLNLIIEIKNNSKKLSENKINIIKEYFELLICILENIQNLF